MTRIRGPTTAPIPGHIKVPSTKPALIKTLSRLSRNSLIDLALAWLESDDNPALYPYLESNRNLEEEAEEDYLYTPAKDIEGLRKTYEHLKHEKGTKRDIINRILDGDWRRGISLQQLAMIDFRNLQGNDTALRWTALKLVPLNDPEPRKIASEPDNRPRKRRRVSPESPLYPRIQPASFVSSLSSEISSLVKAHYHIHMIPHTSGSSLPVLRLHVSDSPYANSSNQSSELFLESARTLYVALPNSCPYVYVALSGPAASAKGKDAAASTVKMDIASLKRTVLEAIPKALSRPQQRWSLEPTNLTAKSLKAICALRGSERSGASGGAFSIFSEGEVDDSPLDPRADGDDEAVIARKETMKKKRKALEERDSNADAAKVIGKVAKRFGAVGSQSSVAADENNEGKGHISKPSPSSTPALDRVFVRIENGNSSDVSQPEMKFNLTFSGVDVFAGLRQLAELDCVDAERMPAWMTGEEGASMITLRDGLVLDSKAGGAC